jgi:ADP-ribose pyrophosphatase YjhB (NUDIX family)
MRLGLPSAAPIKLVEAVQVFENRFGRLYNDRIAGAGGVHGRYLRWVWSSQGVVVVPVHRERVGLWAMYRYPISSPSWEFPRGAAEPKESMESAGLREFHEESGMVGRAPRLLGSLHAETGLIASSISVIAVEVESPTSRAGCAEAMESIGNAAWLTDNEIRESMSLGLLTCGITIAAWAMHAASRSGHDS